VDDDQNDDDCEDDDHADIDDDDWVMEDVSDDNLEDDYDGNQEDADCDQEDDQEHGGDHKEVATEKFRFRPVAAKIWWWSLIPSPRLLNFDGRDGAVGEKKCLMRRRRRK